MLVLIVDDEPLVADTLGIIFRNNGYQAEVANSAEDAMKIAASTPPNLVICDIEMPETDGLTLMSDLGTKLPNCPILVLTGAYRSLSKVRSRATSVPQPVDILTKPCGPDELLRAAGKLLNASTL